MKRVTKACCQINNLLPGIFLLCFYMAHAWADPAYVFHITQAQIQVQDGIPLTTLLDRSRLNAAWQYVGLPYSIGQRPLFTANRQTMTTTWYRIPLQPLHLRAERNDLYLLRWQTAGQLAIYADERLIYRSGDMLAWNLFRHPPILLTLNQAADRPPKELLIRIDSLTNAGSALSSLQIGDPASLYHHYFWREWFEFHLPFMAGTGFLLIGFFALGVWLVRRNDYLYLLFFLSSLIITLRRGYFSTEPDRIPFPDEWFNWLSYNALNWQLVVLYFIIVLLNAKRHDRLGFSLILFALLAGVSTLPSLPFMASLVAFKPLLHVATFVATCALNIFAIHSAWLSRSRNGALLGGWFTAVLFFGVIDWFRINFRLSVEGFYLMPYVAIGFYMVFTHIMFRRYVGAIEEVEQVNLNLEQTLKNREDELAKSYQRLREIEQHQTLSRERQRLMQDMHDGVGASLRSALWAVEQGQITGATVAEVLKECLDDLKLAIDSMEPVEADLPLLLATLRYRLAHRLENSGITLHWEVGELPRLNWLDPQNALHILRIFQESFTNILKHAQATLIHVATAIDNAAIQIIISDNGHGFSVDNAQLHGGRGLANQVLRAKAIGATIHWESTASGTHLVLCLPIER